VTIGDLDGDGDQDLVFAGKSGGTTVWQNDGRGGFAALPTFGGRDRTSAIRVGDLDGDGDLDILCANGNGSDRVWLNDGSAAFSSTDQTLGAEIALCVQLGDIDGDGDLDAAVGCSLNMRSLVYVNDRTAQFTVLDSALSEAMSNVAASLFDADGDEDLDLFLGYHDGVDRFYFNEGEGTFTLDPQDLSRHWSYDAAAGDLDLDGDIDLVIAGGNVQDAIWLNDGQGQFTEAVSPFIGDQGLAVALGDFDGDGDLDAVFCHDAGMSPTHKVYIWRNTQ